MEKQLAALMAGARLVVLATDPMARIDIPLFCQRGGHSCDVSLADDVLRFDIRKAGT